LAGGAGFVSADLAGAGVVSVFGGAAAMAPETKATNVSRTTNKIAFFIQIHLPSYLINSWLRELHMECQRELKGNIF
jgi:hypothetical protein